uniref:Speedy/RINGO cell cycle regulator family member A n=2 Tax=Lepisosteus oculatus TaxID=7918 RepID=W5LWX4_LEPOC
MAAFFRLFDDDLVQDFLWMDSCCKITDKYLLAMTFVYFKRACFRISEHTRMNFFIAL